MDPHSISQDYSWRRLGFLQLSIITLLWKREMYGLELSNNLKMNGYPIGAGQLYPTLNRLKKNDLISVREEIRKGANRKFFKTTNSGRKLVRTYLANFMNLFPELIAEYYTFVKDDLYNLTELSPGMVIADLSFRRTDSIWHPETDLCQHIGPTGRMFLTASSKENLSAINDRIEYQKLQDIITIVEVDQGKTHLPDNSVDLVLCAFTLKKNGSEWLIPEMCRILKPNGKGIIIDTLKFEKKADVRYVYTDLFVELSQNDSDTGINLEAVESLLNKNGLIIKNKMENKGVKYLEVMKEN